MQSVMDGDTVLAKASGIYHRGRRQAVILEVINRARQRLVGRMIQERGGVLRLSTGLGSVSWGA